MEKIKFAIKRGWSSKETQILALYAALERTIILNYFQRPDDVPKDHIPTGSIQWVTSVLGYTPKQNNYPEFLRSVLGRHVWETMTWPLQPNIFVKPSDIPKRFEARITNGTYRGKKKPPYWCSEYIDFVDEWRYYVVNGVVIHAGWYDGFNEEKNAPIFNETLIPVGWCGVIDMGMTSDGRFLLVEAGEPYAVGWYGSLRDGELYSKFLIEGWKYLNKIK
jgi:hypothetical protein